MRQYQVIDSELKPVNVDIPKPNSDQILIKVEYIGLNRADLLQIDGLYKSQFNSPGLEVAGYIDGTKKKVCALIEGGGFSDYVVAEKSLVIPLNKNDDLQTFAALPEALTTCWMSLFDIGGMNEHARILIHAAGSGVGVIATQLAKRFGAQVFITSNPIKHDMLKSLGADDCYEYNNFTAIKELSGVDLIIDVMGAKYLQQNLKVLNKYGKIVNLALMDGRHAKIDLGTVLMKNLSITGTTLRFKPLSVKTQYMQSVVEHFIPLINSQVIKPVIDSIYDFDDIHLALQRMHSREHIGKILIKT